MLFSMMPSPAGALEVRVRRLPRLPVVEVHVALPDASVQILRGPCAVLLVGFLHEVVEEPRGLSVAHVVPDCEACQLACREERDPVLLEDLVPTSEVHWRI